ncbi:synaptic vesicle glycoprotein 2B-like [Coccinella septempunctata]|uniref:synaptic vesicle glycoprotein 2B-like n=1 Tax=Coccinella septempunctata TaxID=41139 RepID=UPI001D068BF4|nr:synaptic vesicle glycoprotein 2B-like [Coccinella septempunctata]
MCEDSAYLVSPLESARNSIPDETRRLSFGTIGTNRTGDILVGFHEDALSQATVGRAQVILAIVLGLGLAADCGFVSILDYILPLAEVHLCLGENEKKWLVSVTFLVLAGGSFSWGILGDHLGRRRALISALFVAVLFSGVATVMPTYGTFITAWFCASLGVSGIFPLSFSYLAETCSRATRCRYAGFLHSFWPIGAIYISILADVILPMKGVDIVQDNQEHWSSWHRFLILSIIPTLASLFGLIWTSESPRYLLEASREVEALAVYQRLHKLNNTRTQYGMTELELPGRGAYRERSSSPGRNIFKHHLTSFQEIIRKISTPTHFRVTLLLAILHLIYGFVYVGISSFSVSLLKEYKNQEFFSSRTYVQHEFFTDTAFNRSIENVEYKFTTFKNVSFSHINLNHVLFTSCIFDDSEFVNVKTSKTYFEHVTVQNCRFVDTDITDHHFLESTMRNNTFISLIFECPVDFDYNTFLPDIYYNTLDWADPMFLALFLMGFVMEATQRSKIILGLTALASFSSVGMFYMTNTFAVEMLEFILKILLMCAVNALTVVVIETYPCHVRCTAHGFMRCLYHIASLCAINVYGSLINVILLFPTIITVIVLFAATFLSTKIQDNSKTLL